MDEKLLILFTILTVLNVIIQTVKSLITVKGSKWAAAIINAIAYGLYTVVVVYTVSDLPLWLKATITAIANLIGVFVVKLFEEKSRKDKLWKIEVTLPISSNWNVVIRDLKEKNISYNYSSSEKYLFLNCYCEKQEESKIVKELLMKYDAKFFVAESKTL